MKKRILCAAVAAAMAFSAAGCSGSSSSAASSQTLSAGDYTGTVSAISESSITLSTDAEGELTIPMTDFTTFTMGAPAGGPGEGGNAPDGQAPADGQTPPDKPDGSDSAPDQSQGSAPSGGPGEGGSAPDGQAPADGQTPPEKPNGSDSAPDQAQGSAPSGGPGEGGSAPDGQAPMDGQTPPEKPDGSDSAPDQAQGAAPSGGPGEGSSTSEALTYESISVGDTVTVTVGEDGTAQTVTLAGGMGGPGGGASGSGQPESYTAVTNYTSDASESGQTYSSTGTDENAVLVSDGASVELSNAAITRTSSDSTGGDASSFYGVGAAALVTDGQLTLRNSTITTDAKGGAGVFAYGDGVATVSDSTITTTQDTSGGIHVAGGGTLYASNLTVETSGGSSAAIRSDRGSGTMVVDGGSYTSHGSGSPAVYSTADISIHNASLTATGAEAACIEGLNTIRLFDCDLTGNIPENEQNDCDWNVILYQSMSGDSAVGNSTFEMVGGSLTAQNGGMFYTTNTESTFLLSGVTLTPSADNDFLLKCTGNSNQRGWGQSGANGADCSFTARQQEMTGDVIWDSISQLDFYLLDGSTLTGAFVDDESNAGTGGSGYASLTVEGGSTWVVTGDSVLTNLANAGQIVDSQGRTVTIQSANGTIYVQGTSDVTVTVNNYTTQIDTTGAATADSWSSYAAA